MKKSVALVVLPLLLVLSVLSPSYAGTDGGTHGTLSAADVSSSAGGCVSFTVSFTIAEPHEAWQFVGEVADPRGVHVDELSFTPDGAYNSYTFCSYFRTGTYTASGTLTIHDLSGGADIEEQFSTSFTYTIRTKAAVSIAVTTKKSHAKPCPGKANAHCWRVSVLVVRAGRPWAGRRLAFQALDRSWQALARCTANKAGRCGWYVIVKKRGAARFPLRVISNETGTSKAGVSRTFRLRYY